MLLLLDDIFMLVDDILPMLDDAFFAVLAVVDPTISAVKTDCFKETV